MKHALSKLDQIYLIATQIAKSIDILTAIRWVKQAWNAVNTHTIVNCFKHCGVQACTDKAIDPSADLDNNEQEGDRESQDELQELVQQFEAKLAGLRDEVMSVGHAKKEAVSDSEEEGESDEESPSTITTFREAINCGNNLLKLPSKVKR